MSNGYFATEKYSPLAKALIARIRQYPVEYIASLPNLTAWKTVGPLLLTQVTNEEAYDIHVYPSHYFIPKHYSGLEYSGDDKIYCNQYWGSTHTIEGKKVCSMDLDIRKLKTYVISLIDSPHRGRISTMLNDLGFTDWEFLTLCVLLLIFRIW